MAAWKGTRLSKVIARQPSNHISDWMARLVGLCNAATTHVIDQGVDTCYIGVMCADQRFEFIAGSPALCFVDTLGDRAGVGRERLTSRQAFGDWLAKAGLTEAVTFKVTDRQLEAAKLLREAICRCALCVIGKRPFPQIDIELLNRTAARAPLRPQFRAGKICLVGARPLDAALSVLAADAIELIASPRRDRIRQCPGCAMIFEDTSRPGKRRWCSSARGCGNREKIKRLRARTQT